MFVINGKGQEFPSVIEYSFRKFTHNLNCFFPSASIFSGTKINGWFQSDVLFFITCCCSNSTICSLISTFYCSSNLYCRMLIVGCLDGFIILCISRSIPIILSLFTKKMSEYS